MKFNLNKEVTVRLTPEGLAQLKSEYRHFPAHMPAPRPDGSYNFQLWTLMNIFGETCRNGAPPCFVDNVIEFPETSARR